MQHVYAFGRTALCAVFLLFATSLAAQTRTVTGTLTDEGTGDPLIGATVQVKGTTRGTVTDIDGTYSIEADPSETLVVSYTGYAPQEIAVGETGEISLAMTSGEILDEVVVVAYGQQRKETVTGAVVGVEGTELLQSPAVNLGVTLAGRLPGVVVLQPSGEPRCR